MDDALAFFGHFRKANGGPLDMEYFRTLNIAVQSRANRIFQILSLTLLVVLCFLAVVDINLRRRQVRRVSSSSWSVQREYGSDHNYMSLDQNYDYLWEEEMDARKALIYLLPYKEETERPEVGSITMYGPL